MVNFFKTLFGGKAEETAELKAKRDFDVLKYDGIKALQMGKTAYAIRCLREALKIQDDIESLEFLVGACTQAEQPDEAIEAVGRLIVLKPEDARVLLTRASLFFREERYTEAIADCHRAIALDNNNPQAYFMLAKAQRIAGSSSDVLSGLSQAIVLKDNFAEALMLRAEVLLTGGNYKEGMEDAEKVVKLVPEEENAYLLRGRLFSALGNEGAAEHDFRYVTELNPFNEQAYLQLGSLFITREQLDEAIWLFDEAIELKPDFAQAYSERGRARMLKGDKEGAVEDAKKAIELQPAGDRPVSGKFSNFEDMYSNRVI